MCDLAALVQELISALEPELRLLLDLLVSTHVQLLHTLTICMDACNETELPLLLSNFWLDQARCKCIDVRLQIFSCSVWVGRPTPGASLMNLRYRNERGLSSSSGSNEQRQQASAAAFPKAGKQLVRIQH